MPILPDPVGGEIGLVPEGTEGAPEGVKDEFSYKDVGPYEEEFTGG